jgi:predicted MFS family arabinose efflux permease
MFGVTAILTRPLVAPAARRVAPSRLLGFGTIAVGAATAATSVAHSVLAVVALRAVAGIGDALFYVLASSAVYALTPEGQHGRAQSRFSAVVSAGILIGPIVAETLRLHTGFTAIWLLGAGLCAAAFACVVSLPLPRETPSTRPRAVLERGAVLPGIVIAAQTWSLAAFSIYVALYANHLGLGSAGGPFAIEAIVVLAVRTLGARVFDRFMPLPLAATAMACATSGLALLAAVPHVGALLVGSALLAVSQAIAYPALIYLAVQRAGLEHRTAAVATFTGFFEAGLASAAIVLGVVLDALGFAGLYAVAAGVCALALVPLAVVYRAERERALVAR